MKLETAQRMLDKWIEAEEMVVSGRSYSMGSRSLTRANLNEMNIEYWIKLGGVMFLIKCNAFFNLEKASNNLVKNSNKLHKLGL